MIREPGLIVLLRHLLLPHILAVLRWVPLLEESGKPHRVIAGLNSLNSTIKSPITGEEIREGAFYWVERGTLLVGLAFSLLDVSTEGTGKRPTHSVSELFLLALKQR